ncbi:MAG: SUMF1/EgtB/PvdO family nonheme iron enzyme [Anaerolineales bacterium]|nr:SUMF1/EgtB/PvdO family nonheme iron enzyme [Anaerolineales bacterium]
MKYYELLDVPPDASEEQIKAAYRILVQLHHPDRLQQVSAAVRQYAEERLKKINAAYHALGDPQRRAAYDAAWQAARARPAAPYPDEAYEYAVPHDPAWEQSKKHTRRRAQTAAEAEAAAAYQAWAHEEAERYARARDAERTRQAERENREAEARARKAAEEQYPRARPDPSLGGVLVVHFAPGVWTTLVPVATGTFWMGSDLGDPEAGRAEQPQHQVRLSEYYLGRYPVTNAQYQAFLRATRRAPAAPVPPGHEQHPVVNVTWDDAAAFCRWLSAATSRTFRLPTEAEWEKAARGPEGQRYSWGNEWDPSRLNGEGGPGCLMPVDRFSPAGDSPYGAAALLGNAWEWCADWFDPKLYARRANRLVSDPAGPGTGQGYVVRGGAFDAPARHTRCAYRTFEYPDTARPNLGFRLAAEAT